MKRLITVGIPCYKSEKTIKQVVNEIREEFLKQNRYRYQIVLVNDGSPDDTFEVIRGICAQDTNVVGVNLSKNYGQDCAQFAAISQAEGNIIVFMDDDGQHPAEGIFSLVEKIEEGYDLVYAEFPQKEHSLFKKVTSWLNAKVLEATNRKPRGVYISSFFALSGFSIDALRKYSSPFPSMSGYLLQNTRRIANVKISHRKRLEGSSNYTLGKLVKLAIQGITNFSLVPLQIASWAGVFTATVGILYGIYLVIRKLCVPGVAIGYTSLMSVILFIGGMLMLMIGIMGEYIGRIYILLSNMPQYNIREIVKRHPEELQQGVDV